MDNYLETSSIVNSATPNLAIPGMSGIVLCGGRSSRMGMPKAWLPFGDETMLQRVVGRLMPVFDTLVVVAAPQQELPSLPQRVIVARDEHEGRGPLEGIRAGLRALPSGISAAYITSCDVPLVAEEFVRRMCNELGLHDIAVPADGDFHHPLAAVYRMKVLPAVVELLEADRLRPFFLFEQMDTRRVPISDLRSIDAELNSLANLNHPHEYAAALRKAGLRIPPEIATRLQLDS
jgi:molybdopterin-guanine dinucleotide biosynthesis protein A